MAKNDIKVKDKPDTYDSDSDHQQYIIKSLGFIENIVITMTVTNPK